jgi:hypothetical protein
MEIITLKKGQRRPAGDTTLIIICRPGNETLTSGPKGPTVSLPESDAIALLAKLERKGAKKVYVRGAKTIRAKKG